METKTLRQKLQAIQLELVAPKNQRNNFGNYDYRSCEDILEALKPLLKKYNCLVVIGDGIEQIGDRYYIRSIATIKDCESTEEQFVTAYAREAQDQKGMNDSQLTGSTSSYARKYALNGLFMIDDSKDSDFTNTVAKITPPSPLKQINTTDVVREPINSLTVHCATCNTVMTEMKGVSKTTGKPYHFYKCTKDQTHPLRNI
jgi:hypothetical protein